MSVYITDSDVIQKIAQVEGERWIKQQDLAKYWADHHGRDLSYTIYGAIKAWQEYQMELIEYPLVDKEDDYFSFVIYGGGGWNRYFVRTDGHIAFSRHHTSHNGVEKATAAGFDIE